jgi:hypothetical protein
VEAVMLISQLGLKQDALNGETVIVTGAGVVVMVSAFDGTISPIC